MSVQTKSKLQALHCLLDKELQLLSEQLSTDPDNHHNQSTTYNPLSNQRQKSMQQTGCEQDGVHPCESQMPTENMHNQSCSQQDNYEENDDHGNQLDECQDNISLGEHEQEEHGDAEQEDDEQEEYNEEEEDNVRKGEQQQYANQAQRGNYYPNSNQAQHSYQSKPPIKQNYEYISNAKAEELQSKYNQGINLPLKSNSLSSTTVSDSQKSKLVLRDPYIPDEHNSTFTLQPTPANINNQSNNGEESSNAHLSKEIQGLQQKIKFLEQKMLKSIQVTVSTPTAGGHITPSSRRELSNNSIQRQTSGLKNASELNEGSVERTKKRQVLSQVSIGVNQFHATCNSVSNGNLYSCGTPSVCSQTNSYAKQRRIPRSSKYTDVEREIDNAEISLDISKAALNIRNEVPRVLRRGRSNSQGRTRSQSLGSRRSHNAIESNFQSNPVGIKFQFIPMDCHAQGYSEVLELRKLIAATKGTYENEREMLMSERKKHTEIVAEIQRVELKSKKLSVLLERSSYIDQSYQELVEQYEKSHQIRTHQNGLINQLKAHIDSIKQSTTTNYKSVSVAATTAPNFSHRK